MIGVVTALVAMASVELFRSASGAELGWRGVEAFLWFGVAGLVLAGRRRFPLTVLVVQSVVFVVVGERLEQLGVVFTIQMTLFAALYSAWAWSRRPRELRILTVVVLLGMFGWLLWVLREPEGMNLADDPGLLPAHVAIIVYSIAINIVYFFGAIAWGQAAWLSARRRSHIAEQMRREREQNEQERLRAVQGERIRIARDLHDVVAHHVSGIGVQAAGAARLLHRKPEAAESALETIAASSRQAVSQMHQLVGLLRQADDTAGGRGPQPGLADLTDLVASVEGPETSLRVVGEPHDVPATIGLTLYRIVQEALTNVQRHAGARTVTVTVRHLGSDVEDDGRAGPSVEVEVLDDGRGSSAGAGPSGGFGLTGIAERAAMHRGESEVGPRPTGGFRVRVRIPLDPTSSPPTTQEQP
ncbi:histidine kinase [Aeromicrobium halocynthiae]|uniref:histidine kinase n=1 Tax=Aeromicrobium halocynthiae TaxID=560557 RepID=A0ABP5HHW9_9ACTN